VRNEKRSKGDKQRERGGEEGGKKKTENLEMRGGGKTEAQKAGGTHVARPRS